MSCIALLFAVLTTINMADALKTDITKAQGAPGSLMGLAASRLMSGPRNGGHVSHKQSPENQTPEFDSLRKFVELRLRIDRKNKKLYDAVQELEHIKGGSSEKDEGSVAMKSGTGAQASEILDKWATIKADTYDFYGIQHKEAEVEALNKDRIELEEEMRLLMNDEQPHLAKDAYDLLDKVADLPTASERQSYLSSLGIQDEMYQWLQGVAKQAYEVDKNVVRFRYKHQGEDPPWSQGTYKTLCERNITDPERLLGIEGDKDYKVQRCTPRTKHNATAP